MSTIRLPDDWATQVYDTLMCGHESPADCHEDIVELIKGWAGDIPQTDAGALAFYVRDFMEAAEYPYDPTRPLAEQAAECVDTVVGNSVEVFRLREEVRRLTVEIEDRNAEDIDRAESASERAGGQS